MLLFKCLDDGFASENLSLGGSAYNFSDGSLLSDRAIYSFSPDVKVLFSSGVIRYDYGIENMMAYAIQSYLRIYEVHTTHVTRKSRLFLYDTVYGRF